MLHYPFTHTAMATPKSSLAAVCSPSSNFPITLRPQSPPIKSCHGVNFGTRKGKGMTWYYEMKLEVREHELGRYRVVNESVYSNYCEYATNKLVEAIGIASDTCAFAEFSIEFIAPLRRNDEFVLKVRVYDYSITRFFFEYLIFKLPNQEPIVKAKATGVYMDKDYKPARIPRWMISKFNQFCLRPNGEGCGA